MGFKSNKIIKFEIFYCGKILTSFSKKIVLKRDPTEKLEKSRRLNFAPYGVTFFHTYLQNGSLWSWDKNDCHISDNSKLMFFEIKVNLYF